MNARRATPGSQSSLREANRTRIIEAVKQYGALTQVELAGATGLSPATVSNIVKELATAGLLATAVSTRSGRRAQLVTLARDLGIVAGVHVGSRGLRVALADTSNQIITEHSMPLAHDHRADDVLDRTALLIADMLDAVEATPDEVLAVGVGVPAPVRDTTGRITVPGILRGWDRVAVAEVLSRRLGTPTLADNDANLGALAELRLGAGVGCENLAYIRASHRIGAGLVLDGRPFRGSAGTAGEIGHVTIDENGPICRCGNRGCLETFASGPVLIEMLRGSHGVLTLKDVIHRALDGDPGCRRVVSDAGRHIGVAAASLCNLVNPERIVVGGELALAGEVLLDPLRDAVERCALPTDAGVEIVLGSLGEHAEIRGALALALESAPVANGLVS